MGRAKSFIYGVTIGGVAAGVSVLFLTPKSGKNVRQELKGQMTDFNTSVDDIKHAVYNVRSNINELKTTGLPLVRTTIQDIKGMVDTWRSDIQPHIGRIIEDTKKLGDETKRISLNSNDEKNNH